MPNGTYVWCGRTAGVIPPPTRFDLHAVRVTATTVSKMPYSLLDQLKVKSGVFYLFNGNCQKDLIIFTESSNF